MADRRAGPGAWRQLLRDEGGAAFVYVTVMLVALVGLTSLAVDLGSLHFEKRRQQAVTDLAALAAASDPTRAGAAAAANLVQNGYSAGHLVSVVRGTYEPDPALPAGSRFEENPNGDAFEIAVRTQKDTLFVGALARVAAGGEAPALTGEFDVATSAVAAPDRRAAFAIGSRFVRIERGVMNSLLGALLGTTLSLDAVHYDALASTKVDIFKLAEALATHAGLSAATYEQVAEADVALGTAFQALLAAARSAGAGAQAASALEALAAGTTASPKRVPVRQLISFGHSGGRPLGWAPLSTEVGVFDLVTALAQIANGNSQVQSSLDVLLPTIASATAKVLVGQRPTGSSMVAVGKKGASVETVQTRLQLDLSLRGSGIVSAVQLPLYLDVAKGTARLSALTCTPWERSTSTITLMVSPGVAEAGIGFVPAGEFANLARDPAPTAAPLVQLPGLPVVNGSAHLTWADAGETAVPFTYGDVLAGAKKTTSTSAPPSTLISNLIGSLSTSVVGLDPLGVEALTRQIIHNALPDIDTALLSALTALGANLGQVDTWVSGVRCGTSVLVL